MEVEAASAQIGAGQTHPAQGSAIGAAAHGHLHRLQTGHAHSLAGGLDEVEVGLDLFQHIAVAVLDLHFHGACAVLAVQVIGNVLHIVLLELQLGGIVVAQDVAQLCGGDIAVHLAQVVEALTSLSGLGTRHHGQSTVKLHGNVGGVDHGVLGGAGMHREAGSGVKVLVLDVTGIAAVHRVGKVCTKAGDIEQVGTLANLLVRGKADAQLAVGAALADNGLHSGHDLGHTSLVVSTQQGGAVGGDQGLALHGGKEGEGGDLHHLAGGGQHHIAAVVVFVQDGVHVLAAGIRGSVHVGDQTQCGLFLAAGGGGQGAVDVAVLVHTGILYAQSLQLLHQLVSQIKLPRSGRMGTGLRVRGGVDLDVIKQSFIGAHNKAHSFNNIEGPQFCDPALIIPCFSCFDNLFCALGTESAASTTKFAVKKRFASCFCAAHKTRHRKANKLSGVSFFSVFPLAGRV